MNETLYMSEREREREREGETKRERERAPEDAFCQYQHPALSNAYSCNTIHV